ncbi:MAG: phage tail protein [Gemmatimonadota bacterium]
MSDATLTRLPDLTGPDPTPDATGWHGLASDRVAIPSLRDARLCARVEVEDPDPCTLRARSLGLPDGARIVGIGPHPFTVRARVTPAFPEDERPVLFVVRVDTEDQWEIEGRVEGPCSDTLVFEDVFTESTLDGRYELFIEGLEQTSVVVEVDLVEPEPPAVPEDPCALTLDPTTTRVVPSVREPVEDFPRPPLLSVDPDGCIVEAWDVDRNGRATRPHGAEAVDVLPSVRGGLIARIELGAPVRDAIFWMGRIAILTETRVELFDLGGCSVAPAPLAEPIDDGVALGVSDEGLLVVIQRGPAAPAGPTNVRVFRPDGSELAPPAAFDGRGWYARHRNPAFVFDGQECAYRLVPSRAAAGCCVEPERELSEDEARFFEIVDDLPSLRLRVAYPTSGWAILGPAEPEDPLDSGRPGMRWHRVRVVGAVPDGCTLGVETRTADELDAGDPRVPDGWSPAVTASPCSTVPVAAPDDGRELAADVMVLADPGRFLWLRLTLRSNGRATPRIEALEVERPRRGIARFLPRVFQDSTPEDDFLRRWLALFETTAFEGVAGRMDRYAELFDPRTAPERLLPFLARWLELPVTDGLLADVPRLRRILVHAPEIAQARGTVDGLVLIIRLYTDITVQIVESFVGSSHFTLGCGRELFDGAQGPALGCDTVLSAEAPPVYLGEAPYLGCGTLLECDERGGVVPHHFEVLVPAREICSSEDLALIRLLIEHEKPAHTTFRIRPVAPAGWVVGLHSVLGQEATAEFDRFECDPDTYGLVLLNGPPRPKAVGRGFTLGDDSRLSSAPGPAQFRVDAALGRDTRLGEPSETRKEGDQP